MLYEVVAMFHSHQPVAQVRSTRGRQVRQVVLWTWKGMDEDEILTRAAAISFYALAALVPFLALVITITAWCLPWTGRRPNQNGDIEATAVGPLYELLPATAASVIEQVMVDLRESPPSGIISFGLIVLLWLSSSLFTAVMDAMNRIMDVPETRPFWKRRLIATLMTLTQAAILILALASTVAWPHILRWLGLSQATAALATIVHALTVVGMILSSFALAFHFGPNTDHRYGWITPGSLLGSLVLVCVSLVFRLYVENWGNYGATYGSLAGIVVLLTWIWLCCVVLLTAAELQKVIETASARGEL
jgi:membrane protein